MNNGSLHTRFVWVKPETGFRWFERHGDYRLRWPAEKKGGFTVRYQPPLSLYRIFAALRSKGSQDAADILSFANEYGDILGIPGREYHQLDEAGIDGRRTVRPYAALSMWRHQIRQMQWAVNLWDQFNDETGRKSARLQARKDLQIEIESALRDLATPGCARACLNQNMELFVRPVNLLAFMWLTLARLLSGETVEQACMGNSKNCLGYIYTGSGPRLKKTGTVTCSAACRQAKKRKTAQST